MRSSARPTRHRLPSRPIPQKRRGDAILCVVVRPVESTLRQAWPCVLAGPSYGEPSRRRGPSRTPASNAQPTPQYPQMVPHDWWHPLPQHGLLPSGPGGALLHAGAARDAGRGGNPFWPVIPALPHAGRLEKPAVIETAKAGSNLDRRRAPARAGNAALVIEREEGAGVVANGRALAAPRGETDLRQVVSLRQLAQLVSRFAAGCSDRYNSMRLRRCRCSCGLSVLTIMPSCNGMQQAACKPVRPSTSQTHRRQDP